MEKRRKVFDDGSTIVESVERTTENKKKSNLKIDLDDKIETKSNSSKKTLLVKDVMSAFAGYIPPRANFGDDTPNECKLCEKETSSNIRTICFDCMIKHGKKLYDSAVKALDENATMFDF